MSLIHGADSKNIHSKTVSGFGDEWTRFPQDHLDLSVLNKIFQDYFLIFPWDNLPPDANGADIGCGSGRWAKIVAPRVGHLNLLDASPEALSVAKKNLAEVRNVTFYAASVGEMPFEDESLDFAYSLGVLHHVPDTAGAIRAVASKLKKGSPFLIYLYYAFDNRGRPYRLIWQASDIARRLISRLPRRLRYIVCQIIAGFIYWPLARMAHLLEKVRLLPSSWPLAYYRDKPFYVMRTDALDRFGTRLEQRFTKAQIQKMMVDAGFCSLHFSDHVPFWCAVGIKE